MIKEVHYAGYSTEPSDYECADGQLATSINLISEDNQLKPVFQPAEKFALNAGEQLLWIHKMTGHTHYILLNDGALYWICEENGESERNEITGGTISGTPTLSSIGNTLVVNDNNGIRYFLWTTVREDDEDVQQYVSLGQKPPMLEISFGLHSDFAVWPETMNDASHNRFAKVDVGKMDSNLLPALDRSGAKAYARPKPVMANDATTDDDGNAYFQDFANYYATYSVENIVGNNEQETGDIAIIKNKLTQGVLANINYFINQKGTNANKFVFPFFVRYAYRLYDDSYIMHSYPVLMIPNSRGPVFALDGKEGLRLSDYNDNKVGFYMQGRAYGFLSKLVFSILSNNDTIEELEKWKDIVTSVSIGVSAPVFTLEQSGQVFGWTNMDDANAWDEYYTQSKVNEIAGTGVQSPEWGENDAGINMFKDVFGKLVDRNYVSPDDYGKYFNCYSENGESYSSDYKYPSYIATVPQRSVDEIKAQLTGATNFYVIRELALDELEHTPEQYVITENDALKGLVARQRITDDYRSHDHLSASLMHNYNGRMNYANVTRTPHAPILPTIQVPIAGDRDSETNPATLQLAVTLKNEAQTITAVSDEGETRLTFPLWLYYPDANAKEIDVLLGNTHYRLKLTKHDFLNGSYWLGDIFNPPTAPNPTSDDFPTASANGIPETNKLYTSNVNNPWNFEPNNIKTIGTGKILGICSAARALSEGQFGQFPLYAFTDEGVWALGVNDNGTFKPSQPFTYDVCINPASITRLDSTVLFVTDRGIMIISGSDAQCISNDIFAEHPFDVRDLPGLEQLHTKLGHGADACLPVKSFLGFLRDCQMVYDYVHQHIIVFNPTTTTSNGVTTDDYTYAYVYSLKSKQWGMMFSDLDYKVNSYPDALAVNKAGKLVSFSDTDETLCKGLFVTRPLKLEAPDIHKTVSALIQRGHFQRGDVETVLYGSRDLYTWRLVWSSKDHYLRGFSGTPYKYFRIAGLTKLTDGKSLFGASVKFKQRLTNNLR